MKRIWFWSAVAVTAALVAPVVQADVKTREKTTFALEGVMGGLVRRFGGKAANEGITSTVAVKGNRKSSISDLAGEIIDLTEQKVYTLDVKKKEYRVQTFAEIRAEWEKARADAEKRAKEMKPEEKQEMEQAGQQMEMDVNVKQTGETKTIAGHATRQAILTITMRPKGKTLEEGGGFVMTSDMWLAPRIAALDELAQFQLKYFRAIYGDGFAADMKNMANVMAMYPQFKDLAARMESEGRKLQGTPLSTTVIFEGVKSAEMMKQQEKEKESSSSGGGLGGMLGRRLAGNRGAAEVTPRTKVMTTTSEMLSVDTTVSADDVAIPTDYKLKK